MILRTAFLAAALGAAVAQLVACTDGSAAEPRFEAGPPPDVMSVDTCDAGAATDAACAAYVSCANLTAPTVSFSSDLAPILQSTCGIGGSTCHGDPDYIPFFDIEAGGLPAVFATIVNAPAPENPAIDIVTPGQPANSMLMHKLDGDQCLYTQQCDAIWDASSPLHACGQRMPINGEQLDLATRDTFRRWIAQGAANN